MRIGRILFLLVAITLALSSCQRVHAEERTSARFVDELTFLGDSITAHMASRAEVSPQQIWCSKERYLNLDARIMRARVVAPDTGEEELITQLAARLQPRYLVITLGIDYGVYYYRNEPKTFSLYYEKLIDGIAAASPKTCILPQSIFPVTRACRVITNEMIDNANAVIREIAARRGLHYLDTQSVLRDESGYLLEAYCNSEDGIHLNEEAYRAILAFIEGEAERVRENG